MISFGESIYLQLTQNSLSCLLFLKGTKFLLRNFNNKGEPVKQFDYDKMIKGLDMTEDQFIDLCILCGCDYTESIEGNKFRAIVSQYIKVCVCVKNSSCILIGLIVY